MAEDFTDPFRYGLNNLPPEPPDIFGSLYSADGSGVVGTPPFGGPQVVQAGYRLPFPGRLPPGPLPMPGQSTPPIRMPHIPDWWKATMATVVAPLFFYPRTTIGSSGAEDSPECQEQWRQARADCVEELSKRDPIRGMTGGYTNVEDCARGLVSEICGGNPKSLGYSKKKK